MWYIRTFIAVLLITVSIGSFLTASPDKAAERQKLVSHLQGIVEDLIKGSNPQTALSSVDVEAYLIDGVNYENLAGVLKGESTHCQVVEGKDTKIALSSLVVNDEENASYVIVKTRTPGLTERYHSVVLFKTTGDSWKVKSWHVSH
jgi:hypothetical protein